MKLVIFGATGSVGRHVTSQAVDAGHEVTIFSRGTRNTVPGAATIHGDVLDPEAVARAVEGQDAVICMLGAGMKGRVRSEGTRNVIEAMKRHGVRRLICQTTLGAGDSYGNLNFFWKRIMFGLLLRRAFADHQVQEQYVRRSGLDWTIVRPAAFTDEPATGQYKHGFPGNSPRGLTLKISRADVAGFILRQLTSLDYLHRAPGLSG